MMTYEPIWMESIDEVRYSWEDYELMMKHLKKIITEKGMDNVNENIGKDK